MSTKRARRRLFLGLGLMALASTALIAILVAGRTPSQNPGVSSHGQPITDVRTLRVAMHDNGVVSSPGKLLHAVYEQGVQPSGSMMATVQTDENCAPDAAGVSHCTNRLRMDYGQMMVIQHPHRMSEVPCLAPGERVRVQAA